MRKKMSNAQRAKQFIPFAALKGYEEALRKQEQVKISSIELSEDSQILLDQKLRRLKKGDLLLARYYDDGEIHEISGLLSRIDVNLKYLQIVNTKIALEKLIALSSPVLDSDSES